MENGSGPPALGDLQAVEFRQALHRAADWIATYRERLEDCRIAPATTPGEVRAQFPPSLPAAGVPVERLLDDFDRLIVPHLVHWGHPAFLGYFGSTTTGPGILAEMLAAALNVSAMTWRVSPAATELEGVVVDWLREMLGVPPGFEGVVYDTASVATLHALAAARECAAGAVRRKGLAAGPALAIYVSEEGHSSVEKAAIVLGLGERAVRRIPIDQAQRMRPGALRDALRADQAAGVRPCAVVATVGTTSTAAVDPLLAIADVCRSLDVWLHVDAAYGGALAVLPEGRWVLDGVEMADSLVVNPHKWLFVPLDFSVLYTRRPGVLRNVFALGAPYLRGDAGAPGMPDAMDYSLQLGRRFRALKAWMVWQAFGRDGLEARIREHVRLARLFAAWVDADAHFVIAAPVTMGVVCLRVLMHGSARAIDRLNDDVVREVNRGGAAYLTGTTVDHRRVVRVGLGNVLTTEAHLRTAWRAIRQARAELVGRANRAARGGGA